MDMTWREAHDLVLADTRERNPQLAGMSDDDLLDLVISRLSGTAFVEDLLAEGDRLGTAYRLIVGD